MWAFEGKAGAFYRQNLSNFADFAQPCPVLPQSYSDLPACIPIYWRGTDETATFSCRT